VQFDPLTKIAHSESIQLETKFWNLARLARQIIVEDIEKKVSTLHSRLRADNFKSYEPWQSFDLTLQKLAEW
jgi:hypothetical protein